jgi:hypothetical protein
VALAEFDGLGLQGFVGQRRNPRFEGVDARHGLRVLLDQPVIAAAENLFE